MQGEMLARFILMISCVYIKEYRENRKYIFKALPKGYIYGLVYYI